jgi:hypothetical protein
MLEPSAASFTALERCRPALPGPLSGTLALSASTARALLLSETEGEKIRRHILPASYPLR